MFRSVAWSVRVLLTAVGLALAAAPALAAPTVTVGTVTPSTSLAPAPGFIMGSTFTTFTVPVTVVDNGGGDTSARRVTISTTRTGGAGAALQLRSTGSSGSGGGVTWAVESVITGGTTATIVFRYAEAVLIPNGSALSFTVSVPSVPTTTGDRVDTFTAAFVEGTGGSTASLAPNGLQRYALEVSDVAPPAATEMAGTILSPVVTVVNHSTTTQTLTSAATTLGGTAFATAGTPGALLPVIAAGATGTVTWTNGQVSTVAGPASLTANAGNATATAPAVTRSVVVAPGPLDHFGLAAASSVVAGEPFGVAATARDVYGNAITDYAGTLHLTSSDPAATLPSDESFLPGDLGIHPFASPVTLTTAGIQSVTAEGSGRSGLAPVTVLAAALARIDLTPSAPTVAAGQPTSFTVPGYDAYGNALGDQTSGTTLAVTAPASCIGAACSSVVSGDYLVTATEGLLTSSATLHVVAGPLDHLAVAAPFFATAGQPLDLVVTASDVYGNTVTDFAGSVHLTSSDPRATLPADYAFLPADLGTHAFSGGVTLVTAGSTGIGASGSGAVGATSVEVLAAALDHLVLAPGGATIVAGGAAAFTSTGFDAYDNSRGDTTGETTFTISGSGTCSATGCGATAAGDYLVTGADGTATGTAALQVMPAARDHLVVTPASATAVAGTTATFAAEGRDVYENSLGDVTAETTFTTGDPGTCVAAACGATVAGAYRVTGTDGTASGGADLAVVAGPLDHLVLRPASATIVAGNTTTFGAEGRDQYENTLGDLTADTAFSISGGGSCLASACGTTVAGDAVVTGSDGAASGTATLHVSPAPLDHLLLDPPAATIVAGTATVFTAAGFDHYDNPLGDLTAATSFAISGPGTCSGNACQATVAGDYVVTATQAGASGTASLQVVAAALDHLVLAPASSTTVAGTDVAFTAEGRDVYDNTLGDLTAYATFAIDGAGTCSANACGATAAGDRVVSAVLTYGSATGTAALHVVPAALDHLVLAPASATTAAGTPAPFTATGADRYGNTTGDLTAASSLAISGAGTCDGASCGATIAGDYSVTATSDTASGTATLHVVPAALTELDLTPAAATTVAGTDVAFATVGRDGYGNLIGDVTAATTFAIDGAGTCTGASCGATAAGDYVVSASDGAVTATTTLHVGPAALDRLEITPADPTIAAGTTATFTAAGFDRYGNPLGDLTADTAFTVDQPATCEGAVCGATAAGDYTVSASDGAVSARTALHVTAASLDHLVLAPAAATTVAGTSAGFTAGGFDRFGNAIGDVTGATTFTIDPPGTCDQAACGATAVGSYLVTATDGGATGSATLEVVAGPLDHLVLSPAEATITAGASEEVRAEGRDAFDNSLGDVTAATTFTITPPGMCAANRCGTARAGDATITASDGPATGSALLHVTAAPLDHLVVAPGAATIVAGETTTFTARAADAFGNDLGDVTADATFSVPRPATCSGATCGSRVAGNVTVTASAYGTTGSAVLHVVAGPMFYFVLSPAAPTTAAGTAAAFRASGFDRFANPVGDVTAATTFLIDAPGSCDANACGATAAGDYTVIAINGTATGTTSLRVAPAAAATLALAASATAVEVGTGATFAATADDRFGNPLGDVTAHTTFAIDAPGRCTAATCEATVPGLYTVTARDGAASTTTTLLVTAGPLDHLAVTLAPATISAGGSTTASAEGRDRYDNPLGDVTADTAFAIGAAGCAANACGTTVAGDVEVRAVAGGASGSATLHVDPAALDAITLDPAASTIDAGATTTYSATGSDRYGNGIGDVTADTAFTIDAPGTCSGPACGASIPGEYTVTATDGATSATATLTVVAAALDHLLLTPAETTIAAGSSATFSAEGLDALGNSLGDVTAATVFTLSGAGSCDAATCGAADAGTYTVTGTDGAATGSAVLHVAVPGQVLPQITGFSLRARVGGSVTIDGSGFSFVTRVTIGGRRARFTIVSDSEITATVPARVRSGRVVLDSPGGRATAAGRFNVVPTISRLSARSGRVGSVVTITGAGLADVTTVVFGRRKAHFRVASAGRIVAVVPARARSGRITLRSAGGTAISATTFRVTR